MTGPQKRPAIRNDEHRLLIQLPTKVFMYTLDQIAFMLEVDIAHLKKAMIYFSGRERLRPRTADLVAVNIADHDHQPDWRVSEVEYIRWLKFKKIKFAEPVKPRANKWNP